MQEKCKNMVMRFQSPLVYTFDINNNVLIYAIISNLVCSWNQKYVWSLGKLTAISAVRINKFLDLTLKVPITTAADDKFCDILPNGRQKKVADVTHVMSCLIC